MKEQCGLEEKQKGTSLDQPPSLIRCLLLSAYLETVVAVYKSSGIRNSVAYFKLNKDTRYNSEACYERIMACFPFGVSLSVSLLGFNLILDMFELSSTFITQCCWLKPFRNTFHNTGRPKWKILLSENCIDLLYFKAGMQSLN